MLLHCEGMNRQRQLEQSCNFWQILDDPTLHLSLAWPFRRIWLALLLCSRKRSFEQNLFAWTRGPAEAASLWGMRSNGSCTDQRWQLNDKSSKNVCCVPRCIPSLLYSRETCAKTHDPHTIGGQLRNNIFLTSIQCWWKRSGGIIDICITSHFVLVCGSFVTYDDISLRFLVEVQLRTDML